MDTGVSHQLVPNWRGGPSRRQENSREKENKQNLSCLGYDETLTYPFVSARENSRFSTREPVHLLNQIPAETEVMRTSLLPGLLSSFLRNYNRGTKTVRLYEMGRLYLGIEGDSSKEEEFLGMINSGYAQEKTPHGEAVGFNLFVLKGDVEILLEAMRLPVDRVRYVRSPGPPAIPEYYHPAVSCELWIDHTKVGMIGRQRGCQDYFQPEDCHPG